MSNIKLIIDEDSEIVEDNFDYGYAGDFEKAIPHDSKVISIKINHVNPDDYLAGEDFVSTELDEYLTVLLEHVEHLPHWKTVGLHLKGKNKIPHIHIHYVVASSFKFHSNWSKHRSDFCKKFGYNRDKVFENITFQFKDLDIYRPKYQFLSYPLKEGFVHKNKYSYLYGGVKCMAKHYIDFLTNVGQSINATELAVNLRREKHEERKQNEFLELLDFAKKNKDKFGSFREMLFVFDGYVDQLAEDKKPNPRNYVSNLQKIGSCLGIFKYSSLFH